MAQRSSQALIKKQTDTIAGMLVRIATRLSERFPPEKSIDADSWKSWLWNASIVSLVRHTALVMNHAAASVNRDRFFEFQFNDRKVSICLENDCLWLAEFKSMIELLGGAEDGALSEYVLSDLYGVVLNLVSTVSFDGSKTVSVAVATCDKKKKRLGNFYSPPSLVNFVVEGSLSPLVEGSSAEEILALRVIDPAMGAGVFVTRVFRFLRDAVPTIDAREVAKCVFGVDLDPLAVEVARLSLWLAAGDDRLDPQADFVNLRVGNSLVGCRLDQIDRFPQGALKRKGLRSSEFSEEELRICLKQFENLDVKERMDLWCSFWFMTAEELHQFSKMTNAALSGASNAPLQSLSVYKIVDKLKFFHWQLEFPNVQFDAVIGNPPWEIEKPNSREFFGSIEPEYWNLSKQDALHKQADLLNDDSLSRSWQSRMNLHDAMANWIRNAPVQFENLQPFQHQGKGDVNLYKLFCEQAYYLARSGGRISFIVPSGIYSDSGSRELRNLFLSENSWTSLIGFENSDGAFDIHRSFKYCIFTIKKDGRTAALHASFMQSGTGEAEREQTTFDETVVRKLSPQWLVVPEVENRKVLSLMEKIYDNSNLLGDTAFGDSKICYSREFDMTLDSKYFRQRERLEAEGFLQNSHGRWHHEENEFVPLYEGRMIGQFDDSEKYWVSGKGRRAVWEENSNKKLLGPQYLVSAKLLEKCAATDELKVGFLAVGSATNARTMIAACLSDVACGNSVPVLFLSGGSGNDTRRGALRMPVSEYLSSANQLSRQQFILSLCACLNSFVFDFVIRRKMSGNNLNYYVVAECPLPKIDANNVRLWKLLADMSMELSFTSERFSSELISIGRGGRPFNSSPARRRLLRAYCDVVVASLYGLDRHDMNLVLSEGCTAAGAQNPKGFFRVDRKLPAEERLPSIVIRLMNNLTAQDLRLEEALAATLKLEEALSAALKF